MERPENLTIGQLRAFLAGLDKKVSDETKIFLDTGWDSIQEISPEALSIEEAQPFEIEDPLNHERFGGYTLVEKAGETPASGPNEHVLIIRNLY